MGGICKFSTDNNIVYTTKSLYSNHTAQNCTRFYFSTEPISKLEAECLLIFSNHPNTLSKSACVRRLLNKERADQISTSYKDYVKGRTLNPGQLLIYNVNIPGLEFTKISVACYSQKMFQESLQRPKDSQDAFSTVVRKYMQKIVNEGINSLIICEFDWKGWMNKSNGFREMAKSLQGLAHLKVVVFACQSEDSQTLYMKAIEEQQNEKIKL